VPSLPSLLIVAFALVACGPGSEDRGRTVPAEVSVEVSAELIDELEPWASSDPRFDVGRLDATRLARLREQVVEVLTLDPSNVPALIVQARLTAQGDGAPLVAFPGAAPHDAVVWFEAALAEDPTNVHAHVMLIDLLQRSMQRQQAVQASRRFLASCPDSVDARFGLGLSLLGTGQRDEAEEVLLELLRVATPEQLEKSGQQTAEALSHLYFQQGESQRAEEILLTTTRLVRSQTQLGGERMQPACAFTALGRLYKSQQRGAEALEAYEAAVALEPSNRITLVSLLSLCLDLGDLACAERVLERVPPDSSRHLVEDQQARLEALRRAPSDPVGFAEDSSSRALRRVLAAMQLHDFQGARSEMEGISTEAEPRLLVLAGFLALLEGHNDVAEANLRQAATHPATALGSELGLAHLAIAQRRELDARASILAVSDGLEAAGVSDDHLEQGYQRFLSRMANLGLAWTHANRGEHETAVGYYDRNLAVNPLEIFALIGRGSSLNGLGRHDEAAHALDTVLALDADNPYALAEMGLVAFNRHDDAAAEDYFQRSLANAPEGYTCPHEGLGLVYLRQGLREQARESLATAIEVDPDIEYLKYNGLARIHMDEGRLDEAEALLRKSTSNYPYDGTARDMLAELQALREASPP